MVYLLTVDILIVVMGLCIGSFLGAIIYRLEKNESVARGRSHCPWCAHTLAWFDLVPVASFIWLLGKCRYCRQKISWQYPLVETLTALAFLALVAFQFPSLRADWVSGQFTLMEFFRVAFLWYIASSLIVIFFYDLRHYLIPDVVLFSAIGATLLYYGVFNLDFLIFNAMAAGVVAAGFFLLIFMLSRGNWMGFGDVKLALLLGLWLGFPTILVALFLSFFFGAVVGSLLMIFKRKGLKSELPFAPFLISAAFVSLFFGQQIIEWYLSFHV